MVTPPPASSAKSAFEWEAHHSTPHEFRFLLLSDIPDQVTNVFISYRRDDASGHAGRLSGRLVARLGASRVFMDVQDIQPGQNFAQAIDRTLAQCDHVLAVIGPRWLEMIRARVSSGEDFVRH